MSRLMFAAVMAVGAAQALASEPRGGPEPATFTVVPMTLSTAGPDQIQSVAAGPAGTYFFAGFAATTVTGPRQVVVGKLTAARALDTQFGNGGIAVTTLVHAGGIDEIDVVVQDGKPVVSAVIAAEGVPADRDIALTRLTVDGGLDASFGNLGVRRLNLNTALDTGVSLVSPDAARGLALAANGAIFVHGMHRGFGNASSGGPRSDTDFAMVKLTRDGNLDTTWSGVDGLHSLDIEESNATPRALIALPDGSVIGTGYANSASLGTTQPVVYRLLPGGSLDPNFATGGLFHETVLAIQTEIFGAVLHGDRLVTAGYGRNTGSTNDYVSLRFSIANGLRDTTWGGAPNGAVVVDPSGSSLGSNCRNGLALPGGRTVLIGSTGPGNMPAQDAALVFLNADGQLDESFGLGVETFVFGNDGNDQLWSGASQGGEMVFGGYKGGGPLQTETVNDDAYLVLASNTVLLPVFADGFDSP